MIQWFEVGLSNFREVPAGKHNIEFQYELPHLTEGIILTVIGFLAFGIMIYLSKKHTLK